MVVSKVSEEQDYPKVCIVILNWNGKDITSKCLDSVRGITYPNYEVILIDNGSSDGSQEHFKKNYQWITFIENPKNLGFTGGNNIGIKIGLEKKADYILLLNNDTVADPSFLDELINAGESRKDVGILNPKIYYYDNPDILWYAGGRVSIFRGIPIHLGYQKKDEGQYDDSCEVNFITGCAFLIKRDVIEKIGILDENLFIYSEDLDWCFRAFKAGYKGLYVPSSKIWHKEGMDSKKNSGNEFRMFLGTRNTMYVVYKHSTTFQFSIFLLNFFFNRMIDQTVKRPLKGEFKDLLGIWKGFFAFWPMRKLFFKNNNL